MKALAVAAVCCAVAFPALAASNPPEVVLSKPLPGLVRVGQHVALKGQVLHSPAHVSAALQLRPDGGRWSTVAHSPIGAHHNFAIRWRVTQPRSVPLVSLRVAAIRAGKVIAQTRARHSAIGPKAVYCSPPVPPAVNIPVGSGWIVGGLYLAGGPFPGIFECERNAYTIKVQTPSGTTIASQSVAGGHSYTIVVPAGRYTLHAQVGCSGAATVTAAHQTKANTVCPVP